MTRAKKKVVLGMCGRVGVCTRPAGSGHGVGLLLSPVSEDSMWVNHGGPPSARLSLQLAAAHEGKKGRGEEDTILPQVAGRPG